VSCKSIRGVYANKKDGNLPSQQARHDEPIQVSTRVLLAITQQELLRPMMNLVSQREKKPHKKKIHILSGKFTSKKSPAKLLSRAIQSTLHQKWLGSGFRLFRTKMERFTISRLVMLLFKRAGGMLSISKTQSSKKGAHTSRRLAIKRENNNV